MKKAYYFLLFVFTYLFFSMSLVSAQKKMKGICTNQSLTDSIFSFNYNRDTTNDGAFVTRYKILNCKGFTDIEIVHLQSEQRIEISFALSDGTGIRKKVIKYESNGGFIFVDGTDTVQFDHSKKYRYVLFFDNEQKEGYVFLHQFTNLNEENPKVHLRMDEISQEFIKSNIEKVEYYLVKGTPARRAVYKIYLDSLNNEKRIKWQADSIALGTRASYAYKQIAFLQKRDTTILNGSISMTNNYINVTRKELSTIIDSSLQNYHNFYFRTYCKFLADTLGKLQELNFGNINSDLNNTKLIMRDLRDQVSKHKLTTMMMYDDSGVAYTMTTLIQFPVSFEKQTNNIKVFTYKHAEPKLIGYTFKDSIYRRVLIDSLKKRKPGKYQMTLNYLNIINDTSYSISRFKNVSDKKYLKIGCGVGTFFSQFGNNPFDYTHDLNFPYLSFSIQYHYGGLFFASNLIPAFGKSGRIYICDQTIENTISKTYNSDMIYSEFGIYVSPAHLIYLKAGIATQKNVWIVKEYSNNSTSEFCMEKASDANGYVLGVAFAPKYFTLEAGYNTLIKKPFVNLGFNIPVSIKL